MGKWLWVSCLGVVSLGVLSFLRVVSNEIYVIEQEAQYLRKKELANKRSPQKDARLKDAA